MVRRFEQGERRALAGKPIVVEAVRGIKPAEATTYVMGYMKSLTAVIGEIGITDPQEIGVHESFLHIAVQDQRVEGTSGIEGISDGSRAITSQESSYRHLGQSPWNHYKDGHKIGFAFARANTRHGKFAALAHAQDIPEELQQQLLPEMQEWLTNMDIHKIKPELVLNLHPVSREVFAYIVENGDEGYDAFSHQLVERVIKSPHYEGDKKSEIIKGIGITARFARRAREVKSL